VKYDSRCTNVDGTCKYSLVERGYIWATLHTERGYLWATLHTERGYLWATLHTERGYLWATMHTERGYLWATLHTEPGYSPQAQMNSYPIGWKRMESRMKNWRSLHYYTENILCVHFILLNWKYVHKVFTILLANFQSLFKVSLLFFSSWPLSLC
jgi:hypothetical protein